MSLMMASLSDTGVTLGGDQCSDDADHAALATRGRVKLGFAFCHSACSMSFVGNPTAPQAGSIASMCVWLNLILNSVGSKPRTFLTDLPFQSD
jgi:hypothetical protein